MRIFINGKVLDPNDAPIVLILDKEDIANIRAMPGDHTRLGCFPSDWTVEQCQAVMDDLTKLIGPPPSRA